MRMFKINIENVQALVTNSYISHAEAAFGRAGTDGIKLLLNSVKLIFQQCPPERLPGTLTVVTGIAATPLSPVIGTFGSPTACADYVDVGRFLADSQPGSNAVVEITADGSFRLLVLTGDVDLNALAQSSLIYRFDGDAERILAKEHEDFVPLVSPILKSNFAVPTLHSLEEAFRYYREYARESKCRILKEIWEGGVDGPRLVLVNKPEAKMRDSLAQALELLLRDVTVKPEQNTDETKPVDLRLNWFASGATALIEVKWLGKATAKSKTQGLEATYTEYAASRAQSGADQLADYMDREVRHSNAIAPLGYLVVFDARRKGTKGMADQLTESDAMAFAKETLVFDPDHSKSRPDFAEPVRFFMNPRKSFFLAA
jgi:hypothetical protein